MSIVPIDERVFRNGPEFSAPQRQKGSSIVLGAVFLLIGLGPATATATELVHVELPDPGERIALVAAAPEAGDCGAITTPTGVEFPLDTEHRIALQNQGWKVDVLVSDLEALYASQMTGGGLFGAYHTYTEAIADMDTLALAYPNVMSSKFSIGQTIEGREIWAYKVSDQPDLDEDEPEVFFNAYIHAREAITFEIIFDLARHLVEGYAGDPDIAALVDSREVFFVPVVNPDGVEHNATTNPSGGGMWRKNRRPNEGGTFGVDLNRNFGDHWGYDNSGSSPNPGSDMYRGTGPFSEPETAAMRDFTLAREFSLVVNYHSYGRIELYVPAYDMAVIPDADELLGLTQLRRETSHYPGGPTWHVLYPVNGGANDWLYSEGPDKPRILGIVCEAGGNSFWPSESSIPGLLAENLPGNLLFIEMADDPHRGLPPSIPEMVDPGPVGSEFLLEWNDVNADSSNPATSWNVMEAAGSDRLVDDVETGNASRWRFDGWAASNIRAHSGALSLRGGDTGLSNDVLLSLRAHSVTAGDVLRFWTWYKLAAGFDYGYVEVATASGDFVPIPGNITTNSNPNGQNAGNGITGSSGDWVLATFDLSAFVGETIWIRFHCATDAGVFEGGWFIDQIEPVHAFPTETVIATGVTENQLVLSGHPNGTYSYMVQAVDPDGQKSPWSMPMPVTVLASSSVPEDLTEAWIGLHLRGENPVRETASLSFSVPAGARLGESVSLRVHDVRGRTVAPALSGLVGSVLSVSPAGSGTQLSLLGPGSSLHPGATLEIAWEAKAVRSGVYFLALEVGHRHSRQRVVVVR